MRASWMRRRAVARVSIVALATGLALLAGLAVVTTRNTALTATRISDTEQISHRWGDVYLRVSIEYEQLVEFVRADSDVGREPLISSIGSAEESLRWLNAHGGPSDSFQAEALQNTYGGYSYTLRDLVDAQQRGDRTQMLLDAEQAAMSASALRKQTSVNIARKGLEIGVVLADTQRHSRRLLLAVEVISALDLILVILCAMVLVGYQRNTERQASQSRHRASHDGLTGVANRYLLTERMDQVIATADETDEQVGLLLLDLNRFKEVNDTLGHHAGDLMIQEVARRLNNAGRREDTVARLGGDEFAVLLPDVSSAEDLLSVGRRILDAVCGVADLDGIPVDVSASIGAALYPAPSSTGEELLQHADIAMYAAKRGHLGVALYDPTSDENGVAKLSATGELRNAIDNGELELHYQPKLRVADRTLGGVEALVRWRHPVRGLLSPDEFIPVAEHGGLIRPLTEVVLTAALEQHRSWRADGLLLPVAVNVSAGSLLDPAFPGLVGELIRRYEVAPGQLTIEITESAMITDPARAAAYLADLRALGARVSIDDFGTGYSSMSYLQSMPLDELKIDRQFTARMLSTGSGRAIVGAIVELAHALNLDVVVEGVEDEHTVEAIHEMGCESAQGFLFCRPLAPADLSAWIAARQHTAIPAHVPV
jgi:diguanylate cyclase (GGDEF)-like protein